MKKIIISVLAVILAAGIAGAQTKAETSLYTKTLKKPSIKAYDKFLNKYPESVYRLEVLTLRDTELFESVDKDDAYAVAAFAEQHPDTPVMPLITEIMERHNTSGINKEAARAIASGVYPEAFDAVGYKHMGKESVIAFALEGNQPVAYRVQENEEGTWTGEELKRFDRYTLDSSLDESRFEGSVELLRGGLS